MLGISEAAEAIGFNTIGVKISYEELMKDVPLPAILHWNKNHFIVLPEQKNGWFSSKKTITVADPGLDALVEIDEATFKKCWISGKEGNKDFGTALLLETTEKFLEETEEENKGTNFKRITK